MLLSANMKNQVSLVGRTNVGKSLLFNKLVKSRKSLVVDFEGSTRDINQGLIVHQDKSIILEDTGGFPENKGNYNNQVESRIQQSIQESKLILFMTSSREGLTNKDLEISEILRKHNKRVLLVINMSDLQSKRDNINTFYSLGHKDIYIISAKTNQGVNELKEKIFDILEGNQTSLEENSLRVSFIGKPNVGKSTLINSLIKKELMITSDISGTTLDAIEIKYRDKRNKFRLYDTAGILKKSQTKSIIQKFSIAQTLSTIKNTDICILVLNAQDGITKQDKLILNYIKKYNKAFFIVANKVDTLSTVDLKKLKNDIKYFSNITNNANIFFISAILRKNISKIPLTIAVLGKLLNKRYKSAKLTKILNDATSKHEPPIYNKKRPKLKFAQQSSLRELVIHIYGNGLKYISPSYKKYLLNYFSTELNLIGLPLEVKFTQKKEPI